MKTPALALGFLLLAGAVTAQKTTTEKTSTEKVDAGRLIQQLGDPEYAVRKAAEKGLLERGKKVLPQLKAIAKSTDDPEVKWRAGRLVRRIEAGGAQPGGLAKRSKRQNKTTDPIERPTPGASSPRTRGMPDVFEVLRQNLGESGLDPRALESLERMMKQMQGDLEQGGGVRVFDFPGIDVWKIDPQALRRLSTGVGRSMKMSMGPDGVRVEIEETGKDGKSQRKVYEAEDMEAFKKKYPGVLDSKGSVLRKLQPRSSRAPKATIKIPAPIPTPIPPSPIKAGKKLGFYVGELAPSVREYLGLDDGLGLMVDRIAEGSLAEKLKLRSRDIVVKVCATKIHTAEDVARGLEGIEADSDVTVEVIRRGKRLVLKLK